MRPTHTDNTAARDIPADTLWLLDISITEAVERYRRALAHFRVADTEYATLTTGLDRIVALAEDARKKHAHAVTESREIYRRERRRTARRHPGITASEVFRYEYDHPLSDDQVAIAPASPDELKQRAALVVNVRRIADDVVTLHHIADTAASILIERTLRDSHLETTASETLATVAAALAELNHATSRTRTAHSAATTDPHTQ